MKRSFICAAILLNIALPGWMDKKAAAADAKGPELLGDSVMKGTPKEREAEIAKALNGHGRFNQFTANGLAFATALQFLHMQMKVDIAVDWDELAKVGISRDATVTCTLHDKSPAETLEVLLSILNPTSGSVGYKLENGMLVITPLKEVVAPDPKLEAARNAATNEALKQKMVLDPIDGDAVPLEKMLALVQVRQKIDMAVDWDQLKKAGIDKETKVPANLTAKTLGEFLQQLLANLKPAKGAVIYKVVGGVVRVTAEGTKEK